MLPNLEALGESSVVAGNVRSTLRLTESEESVRRRLHVTVRPGSQVLVIRATAANGDRARQLAQEAAVVFSQLVTARFATTKPKLRAAIFDSAHALASQRPILSDSLIGVGIGLALGLLFAAALGTVGPPAIPVRGPPDVVGLDRREKLLERRIEQVTQREREIAKRAGRLAARERELEERERESALGAPPPSPPPAAAPPEAEPTPEPEPEPAAAPEPVPAPRPLDMHNVGDLERAVEAAGDADPARAEEWRTYLFFLREHAAVDGTLPSQFDSLVAEVFGTLEPRP